MIGWADEDVLRPRGRPAGELTTIEPRGIVRNPWSLGIEAGATSSFFAQDITLYDPDYTNNLTSGSGIGPFAALAFDYALTNEVGLQLRFAFDQKRFSGDGSMDVPCTLRPTGEIIPAQLGVSYSQTVNYWTIGTGLRFTVADNWLLQAGITYHSRSSASLTETDTILSPDGCEFLNNETGEPLPPPFNRRQTIDTTTTEYFSASRISFDASVGYRIPLSESIVLVPRIGAQVFFNRVANDLDLPNTAPLYSYTNRRLHALLFAVSLWFNL